MNIDVIVSDFEKAAQVGVNTNVINMIDESPLVARSPHPNDDLIFPIEEINSPSNP